ncbi:hypothetical protein pb186bvf_001538 [Paramecium bursaria]
MFNFTFASQQMSCQIKVCLVAGHQKQLAKYVCTFPECKKNRFVCPDCLLKQIHQHGFSVNNHILDSKKLYQKFKASLNLFKPDQKIIQIDLLKQIVQEMNNLIQSMIKTIASIEQGDQQFNFNQLQKEVEKLNTSGFNQLDDGLLNALINLDKIQQKEDHFSQLQNYSQIMIQNANRIKESMLQQSFVQNQEVVIKELQNTQACVSTISNDQKYIITGDNKGMIKIWNYGDNKFINEINLHKTIKICKFSEDSQVLNVGVHQNIYQFEVKQQFREIHKQELHDQEICNFYFITNSLLLSSHSDGIIIKKDLSILQPQLKIQAHSNRIDGLHFHKNLKIILSGSYDQSIRLWNADNGDLIMQKQDAHTNQREIHQVFFVIKNNLIISLDRYNQLIIWKVNFDQNKLEQYKTLSDNQNNYFNMSLFQDQYIVLVCLKNVLIYTLDRQLVKSIDHNVKQLEMFNTTQPESMKTIIIQGTNSVSICNIDLK